VIRGKKVNLRAIEREDLPLLRDMRNDVSQNQYFRTWKQLNMENQENFFQNFIMSDKHIVFGIYLQCRSCLIGECRLSYIDWQKRSAEVGIYIAPKYQNRGFGTEALKMLADYGFNQANLHRIATEIQVDNRKSIKMFEKVGFQHEGLLVDSFYRNGRYYNTIIMALIQGPARFS